MSALLNQAIASLNLQPGEVFKTKVNGHDVEVRVLPPATVAPAADEPSQFAEMVMMEPWFEIPEAPILKTVRVKRGSLPPSDPPIIPPDDELPANEVTG